MDYDLQRCSRACSKTGRELAPGEVVYSMLIAEGSGVARRDFGAEAWEGPPAEAIGWWKSKIPMPESKKGWAPNDVMLDLFEQLESQPDKQDMRYVLGLLLVRRRVLRVEDMVSDETGESQVLYCPRREMQYTVRVTMPDDARAQKIQDELAKLLSVEA